jgi:glycosyltransferase involved in cell wall biosynthesis
VALIVSRLTDLPWVADFRDAWTLNPQGARGFTKLSAQLEQRVVRQASRLVLVDDSIELVGMAVDDPRRVVIPNGVDPDDLPSLADTTRGPRLRFAHVGMLYGARDAAPVFAAFRNLIGRGALDGDKIEVRIVGDARLGTGIADGALSVSRRGYVDHRDALAEMQAADVLLLYQPTGQRGSSGKIYEYLATGRPVLCVAPSDNVAARLVTELGAGACAVSDDQASIEDAVERLYHAWSGGRLEASAHVREMTLRRFSRKQLARQLAGVLDSACRLGPRV